MVARYRTRYDSEEVEYIVVPSLGQMLNALSFFCTFCVGLKVSVVYY